jgi:hypothetical protein
MCDSSIYEGHDRYMKEGKVSENKKMEESRKHESDVIHMPESRTRGRILGRNFDKSLQSL